jgi:hypothetical protein
MFGVSAASEPKEINALSARAGGVREEDTLTGFRTAGEG